MKTAPYRTIEDMHKYMVAKALDRAKNKKEAAKLLGITERTLHNKLKTWKN